MIYFTFGCMGNIHFTFQSGYIQIVTNADDRNTQLTLHSNLVIFKWLSQISYCENKLLYIPIWLYSNLLYFFDVSFLFHLYIPIWLYSNNFIRYKQTLI